MRLLWLAAAVGALLLIGMVAQQPSMRVADGEVEGARALYAAAGPAAAELRTTAGSDSGVARAARTDPPGSERDAATLDIHLRAFEAPVEAVRGRAQSAGASSTARLTSVDAWLTTMGVSLKAADRVQHQLQAAHVAYEQPYDPAPWAEPPVRTGTAKPPAVSASAAVVLDEASAAVLYGKNEGERLPPASTTKIATLILAVEHGRLDEVVENTVDSRRMPGSSVMGLVPGDRFTLRDVLYGLMLPSGNDAALSVGRHVAGSDEAFMVEIERLLQRLGLQDTRFIDPHGLGRGGGHYSTAVEMALLARYGMQMPEFREIVATPQVRVSGSRQLDLRSTNQFLTQYAGADGVKTGFTYAGGPTFVGSAVRDGRRVYVVLLNSGDRPGEAARLLDWAFENHAWDEPEPAPLRVAEPRQAADLEEDGVIEAAGVR